MQIAGGMVMASVIDIGSSRAIEDQLSVGGFVAFSAALGLLFSPDQAPDRLTHPLQRGLAAAESVFAVIDQPEEIDNGTLRLESTARVACASNRWRSVIPAPKRTRWDQHRRTSHRAV